jgi:hypothetical protein
LELIIKNMQETQQIPRQHFVSSNLFLLPMLNLSNNGLLLSVMKEYWTSMTPNLVSKEPELEPSKYTKKEE